MGGGPEHRTKKRAYNTIGQETPAWPVCTEGRYPPEASCRKYATKVQNETELMLLKGDVLRTSIKCRAN